MLRKLIVGAVVVNFMLILISVVAPTVAKYQDAAIAANTSASYTAGATVTEILEINANLFSMLANGSDINFESNPSSMDFGALSPVEDENNTILYMAGNTSYAVVMYPATSGRAYQLLFTGEALTGNQGGSIGDGTDATLGSTQDAYVVVPDYQWLDKIGPSAQGAPPTGASVGFPARVATSTNHVLYTSGPAGMTRAVRAYFGIGGPPVSGIIKSCSKGHNGALDCTASGGADQEYNEGAAWDLVQPDQKAGAYSGDVTFTLTTS